MAWSEGLQSGVGNFNMGLNCYTAAWRTWRALGERTETDEGAWAQGDKPTRGSKAARLRHVINNLYLIERQ